MKAFHNFPQSITGTITSATSQEIELSPDAWEDGDDGYQISADVPELGLEACDQAILWLQPAESCTKDEKKAVRKAGFDTAVKDGEPLILIDEKPSVVYKVQITALKIIGGGV